MAAPAHLAIFLQGAADPWNEWRRSNPDVRPDLSGVVWAGSLAGYDLSNADLTRAVLPHVNFADSDLTGTILREAILRDADLTGVKGLMQPSQVAGADLSGAQLPDSLQESLGDLDVAKGISGNAQKLFVAVLAACLYCWLTISTTTDASLITNRASSPLPIIQTAIPIVDFYIIAPLLILCVYFYFHLYLQKLWDELSAQPAIFPDGRPLHAKADPWLLSDLVQSHLFHLRSERPLLAYFQVWIARLLAWWVVPLTLALFWLRYLVRQNPAGTAYHCLLTAIAASAAFSLYGLAARTLCGAPRHRFSRWPLSTSGNGWRIAVTAVASVSLLSLFSLAIFKGVRQRPWLPQSDEPGAWLPGVLSQIGYKPFPDLTGAELSVKPPNWSEKSDPGLDNILGLQLGEVSLRFADMPLAFLPRARLSGLNLHGAEMIASDLRKAHLGDADLSQANLEGARLDGADLKRADLQAANLFHTDFSGAELLYANFQNATGLNFDAAQKGKDWCEAQYPGAFHLGSAYNQRIQAHNNADRDFARSGEIAREIARIEEIKRTNPTVSLDDIEKAYYSKATAVLGDDLQSDEPPAATARAIKPIPWPAGETPAAQPLASTPPADSPLPAADYLVITWTINETKALADVFTPGHPPNSWYKYAHSFDSKFKKRIRQQAPASQLGALGRYFLSKVGSRMVLCFKSELHLSQDGPDLPLLNLLQQIIQESHPKLAISTGTAGGLGGSLGLGDVAIASKTVFRCARLFKSLDGLNFSNAVDLPVERLAWANQNLMQANAAPLSAERLSAPSIYWDEKRMQVPAVVVTTDFFAFADVTNHYGINRSGAAAEMGDAVLGMACQKLGDKAPKWLSIRNISDPLLCGESIYQEAVDAARIYKNYGYWTSVQSAIATWAVISGNR